MSCTFDSPRGFGRELKKAFYSRPKLRLSLMGDQRKQADVSWPSVKRALSHAGRLDLFTFLLDRDTGKPTNEQELAEALGMSLRLVEYHLSVLEGAELVANIADELGVESESCYVATARL